MEEKKAVGLWGRIRKSTFFAVFNLRQTPARCRTFILISAVVDGMLAYVNGGIFYTSFLSGYDMDITRIGILSFIPYIASLFAVFTPALLNLFPKRRFILAGLKLLGYFSQLVGLTLLPKFVTDPSGRMVGMIAILLFAGICNNIATAGYASWYLSFMPEEQRSYYLSVSIFLPALLSGAMVLVSGWITDRLAAMGDGQLSFIVGLRYFAFGLALLSLLGLLTLPEVEHPTLHAPRITDIFTIPIRNRRFMLTMVICFVWNFTNTCYGAQLNVYLTQEIHVSYTFYNLIIFVYSFFFLLFKNFWQRRLHTGSWFRVFALCLWIVGPLQMLYGFVTPTNYIPLMLIVRLPQHFAGVGQNVAFSNFQYINMPQHNRESFSSFYLIVLNAGALCGMVFGTVFTDLLQNFSFTLFGQTYASGVPLLVMISGLLQTLLFFYVWPLRRELEPKTV